MILKLMMNRLLEIMNEKLQKQLSSLENLIGTQSDSVYVGGSGVNYMHGMLNGLICAHSVFAECEPAFVERPPRRWDSKIRHKSQQPKRRK